MESILNLAKIFEVHNLNHIYGFCLTLLSAQCSCFTLGLGKLSGLLYA